MKVGSDNSDITEYFGILQKLEGFVMNESPCVSVVVLTFNRARDLRRCLDSIKRQTVRNIEIIVVDNGSTDCTFGVVQEYSVRFIRDSTKCKSYLRNLGYRSATAKTIAFIDDDAEADPSWIKEIIESFERFESVDAVGGPAISTRKQLSLLEKTSHSRFLSPLAKIYETIILENSARTVGAMFESGALSIGGSLDYSAKLKKSFNVDVLTTCNLAVKRYALEEIGGFDEDFIFNNEDVDLCVRMRKAGFKLLFNPKAVVWHNINPDAKTRSSPFFFGRDFAIFYMKDVCPKSLSTFFRLFLNVCFFISQFFYKAFLTKNHNEIFKGVSGFVTGISNYIRNRNAAVKRSAGAKTE